MTPKHVADALGKHMSLRRRYSSRLCIRQEGRQVSTCHLIIFVQFHEDRQSSCTLAIDKPGISQPLSEVRRHLLKPFQQIRGQGIAAGPHCQQLFDVDPQGGRLPLVRD